VPLETRNAPSYVVPMDPEYGDWLAEHPLGYVLTHRGHDDAAILHRADCLRNSLTG
jgi:hypothetical protein